MRGRGAAGGEGPGAGGEESLACQLVLGGRGGGAGDHLEDARPPLRQLNRHPVDVRPLEDHHADPDGAADRHGSRGGGNDRDGVRDADRIRDERVAGTGQVDGARQLKVVQQRHGGGGKVRGRRLDERAAHEGSSGCEWHIGKRLAEHANLAGARRDHGARRKNRRGRQYPPVAQVGVGVRGERAGTIDRRRVGETRARRGQERGDAREAGDEDAEGHEHLEERHSRPRLSRRCGSGSAAGCEVWTHGFMFTSSRLRRGLFPGQRRPPSNSQPTAERSPRPSRGRSAG